MGGDDQAIGTAEAASALRWWLEAGVDALVQEEPRDWLNPTAPRQMASESPAVAASNVTAPTPETLAELQQWLASSTQLPLASSTARRILPHGVEDPAIMLLSDAPALEDFAAGRPIGGDAWELTVRMLAAIGIEADHAYVAPLSCFHSPGARLSRDELDECGALARRHVALAKPKRLLLFGDGPARALLGKPLLEARGHLHKVEGVRTVATFHPRFLLGRPADKALAWKDLLLLMEDEA